MPSSSFCLAVILTVVLLTNTAAASWFSWTRPASQPHQRVATPTAAAWRSTDHHGEIASLPGYEGNLPSRHYGGYISVGTRQLYYYLAESERSPKDDPVV